jgi:hypothetical protein
MILLLALLMWLPLVLVYLTFFAAVTEPTAG